MAAPTTETQRTTADSTCHSFSDATAELKAALSSLANDTNQGRANLVRAIDRAASSIGEHVRAEEAGVGLLAEVSERAPRLTYRIDRLRQEHHHLNETVRHLQHSVGDLQAGGRAGIGELQHQTSQLVSSLARHDRLGADLLHEAYEVDLGDAC